MKLAGGKNPIKQLSIHPCGFFMFVLLGVFWPFGSVGWHFLRRSQPLFLQLFFCHSLLSLSCSPGLQSHDRRTTCYCPQETETLFLLFSLRVFFQLQIFLLVLFRFSAKIPNLWLVSVFFFFYCKFYNCFLMSLSADSNIWVISGLVFCGLFLVLVIGHLFLLLPV